MAIPIYRGNFNSLKSYPLMSIVTDNSSVDKTLYIAVADVPTGSSLSNTSYWNTYYFDIKSVISGMIEAVVGKLSDLHTSSKTTVVSAINEVNDEEEALSETVSDIVDGTISIPHQCDWSQSDDTANDYIKNKPTIPSAQVQSDWTQTDNTQVDFIKNKPTIPSTASGISYDNTTSGMSSDDVQDAIDELEMTKLSSIPIATTSVLGGIKPDGTTITVDENGIASASGGGSGHTYSTTEQVIGKWIDGKDLYEQVSIVQATIGTDVSSDVNNFTTGGRSDIGSTTVLPNDLEVLYTKASFEADYGAQPKIMYVTPVSKTTKITFISTNATTESAFRYIINVGTTIGGREVTNIEVNSSGTYILDLNNYQISSNAVYITISINRHYDEGLPIGAKITNLLVSNEYDTIIKNDLIHSGTYYINQYTKL